MAGITKKKPQEFKMGDIVKGKPGAMIHRNTHIGGILKAVVIEERDSDDEIKVAIFEFKGNKGTNRKGDTAYVPIDRIDYLSNERYSTKEILEAYSDICENNHCGACPLKCLDDCDDTLKEDPEKFIKVITEYLDGQKNPVIKTEYFNNEADDTLYKVVSDSSDYGNYKVTKVKFEHECDETSVEAEEDIEWDKDEYDEACEDYELITHEEFDNRLKEYFQKIIDMFNTK